MPKEMPLIYSKISAVMNEIGAIGKNKQNATQHFKYRSIDDFYNVLKPLMATHKIFTVPTILAERREERTSQRGGTLIYRMLTIEYSVYAEDGSVIRGSVEGEAMDSGDKAANKAMAAAHKYFLMQLFCVPLEELKDPDGESYEVKTSEVKINAKEQSILKLSIKEIEDIFEKAENLNDLAIKFEPIYRAFKDNSPERIDELLETKETYKLKLIQKKTY